MNIGFNGFCENTITFEADKSVTKGCLVKLTGDNTVSAAGSGDKFCGVCVNVREGYAAVQLSGYAEIAVSGTVEVGYQKLSAASSAAVKANEAGREYLVVSADTDTAGIML